ncbi:periplasmic nitrate reductase, large subunit, partial [Vibrio cholerae HC-52A1]|jgi:hypothetical protein
MYEN